MIRLSFQPAVRPLLCFLIVIFFGLFAGCSGKPSSSVELGEEWRLRIDPSDAGKSENWYRLDYPKIEWHRTKLHEFEGRHGYGVHNDAVWLVKEFQASGRDSSLILVFRRVYGELEVWLNGQQIGFARAQGDAVTFNVAHLEPGENVVVVRLGARGELYTPVSLVLPDDLPLALGSPLRNKTARRSPDWVRDAVVYEISVRSFSKEGTFKAVEERVKDLRDFGASVLLLMPVHPIGDVNRSGSFGNLNAVQDFLAVNREFGSLEDLQSLVETVHRHGMKILIDLPANQAAWDSRLMFEHPEWFLKDESGAIISPHPRAIDVAGLNYEHHELRKYMISVIEFWVKEVGIDGYRFDGVGLIPSDFWEIVRNRLENIKPVMLISDDSDPQHHLSAFDVSSAWASYYCMAGIVAREIPAPALNEVLRNEQLRFPQGSLHLRFATQPREPFWQFSAPRPTGNDNARILAAAATFLLSGVPLIHNGDETGSRHVLGGDEKNLVDWKTRPAFQKLYRQLIQLRMEKEVFRRGEIRYLGNSNEQTVASFERTFGRDRAFVLLNWAENPASVVVQLEPIDGEWREYFGGGTLKGTKALEIRLDPFSFKVFLSESISQ